jgi:hypothetical protein
MAALARREHGVAWYVDLATGRVVRRVPPEAHTGTVGRRLLPREEATMAENELDPREDLKDAKEFLRHLHPLKAVKEALTEAAELLDPAESDPRVVVPEPDTLSEVAEDGPGGKPPKPRDVHPMPDAKELEKEHRGY